MEQARIKPPSNVTRIGGSRIAEVFAKARGTVEILKLEFVAGARAFVTDSWQQPARTQTGSETVPNVMVHYSDCRLRFLEQTGKVTFLYGIDKIHS